MSEARRITVESDRRIDNARDHVDVSVGNVERYRDADYAVLHDLVTKVQTQGFVSSAELEEIITRVLAQKGQLDNLLARLKQVQDELRVSRELRQQIDTKLTEALARVAAKDTEADTLRQQLADQQQTTKALEQNAQKNMETAIKAKGEVERVKGRLDIFIKATVAISVLALVSLLCNYLQFRRGGITPF